MSLGFVTYPHKPQCLKGIYKTACKTFQGPWENTVEKFVSDPLSTSLQGTGKAGSWCPLMIWKPNGSWLESVCNRGHLFAKEHGVNANSAFAKNAKKQAAIKPREKRIGMIPTR